MRTWRRVSSRFVLESTDAQSLDKTMPQDQPVELVGAPYYASGSSIGRHSQGPCAFSEDSIKRHSVRGLLESAAP